MRGRRGGSGWYVVFALSACGQASPRPFAPAQPTPVASIAAQGERAPSAPNAIGADAGTDVDASPLDAAGDTRGTASAVNEVRDASVAQATAPIEATEAGTCPEGMQLVDTMYCPRIERKCLDEEYSPQNHITICHKFAKTQRCLVPEQRRRFCIDTYEYPNRAGAHPAWMVSWYDAQATCGALGKRTCYESEWVAACEGPEKTPFPYGHVRDNAKCNIDNTWVSPHLPELYGSDPQAKLRELSRLDQSVVSGALAGCVSGFGVHDLTGNFDEWVTADERHDDKSEWAALKGGAWGHVRNACRPVTTSHPPDFTYYFVAFRCCSDVPGSEPYAPKLSKDGPPVVPPSDRAPIPAPVGAPGPSPIKVAPEVWPRPGKAVAPAQR